VRTYEEEEEEEEEEDLKPEQITYEIIMRSGENLG